MRSLPIDELRLELIGIDATNFTKQFAPDYSVVREVRIRATARSHDRDAARAVGFEVEALYTNGPAGGGGAFSSDREVVAITSCLINRDAVDMRLAWVES